MSNRFIAILNIFLLLPVLSYSQTVIWSVPPTYELLEQYGNLYKIREKGKVGLADISGKVLVSADYDSITPFKDHLALALEYDSEKYALKGIINEHNYSTIPIFERYYVTEKYPYFSEGKLVIYDDNNKYGYLQADGSLFRSCQYYGTYPFYLGLACIYKEKENVVYIHGNGMELNTQVERGGYLLTWGSSFNEKGEACVVGRCGKSIKKNIIDTQGQFIRNAKFKGEEPRNYEYRKPFSFSKNQDTPLLLDGINTFQKEGKYGFLDVNSTIILPPQFSEAVSFKGGYAKVKKNGKYGVLKLQSGSFNGRVDKDIVKVLNGKSEVASYSITVPSSYINKSISVKLDQGDNVIEELKPIASEGASENYIFIPTPKNKEAEIICYFSIQADGIILLEDTQKITLKYIEQRPPVLSVPQVTNDFKVDAEGYVRADSNNKVDVYATIGNNSSEVLYISVTIGGNGVIEETKKVSVIPGTSARISTSTNTIKERKPVEVFVKTSTGLKQSRIIKVKPFI